jgi:nitroreductase
MDVWEAIRTRRTIAKFRPEPVPRETLRRILEVGIWAPNHHLTEPWRFVIMGPETQARLSVCFGEWKAAKAAGSPERQARLREDEARRFRAIPTIVAVAAAQEGDEQRRREDYAAVCCAVQNVQLAAWAEGVGVKWSTAGVTRDPLAYEFLGFDPDQFLIAGFLFVGYPAETPTRERRRPLDEVIRQTP